MALYILSLGYKSACNFFSVSKVYELENKSLNYYIFPSRKMLGFSLFAYQRHDLTKVKRLWTLGWILYQNSLILIVFIAPHLAQVPILCFILRVKRVLHHLPLILGGFESV